MNDMFSRQSFLGPDSERRLTEVRIGLVGLCGGGSPIAQQLAHLGVAHFILCDPDRAEDSNLNRMVGLEDMDVRGRVEGGGERKVDVAERLIKRVRPNAEILKIHGSWQHALGALKECDYLFGCVDQLTTREELERFTRRYLIPYLDLGMDVHGKGDDHYVTGQVILSLPGRPCMRCMGFVTDERLAKEAEHYGTAGGRPQVIWPNAILAATAVGKFVALLTPWNRSLKPALYTEYDGNRETLQESLRVTAVDLESRPCPHFSGPRSVGDVLAH